MKFEIKKTIFIYSVIAVCILVALYSFTGDFDTNSFLKKISTTKQLSGQLISYFSGVEYYELDSYNKKIFFKASNLVYDNTDYNSQSIAPNGVVYGKDGEIINYSAGSSIYNPLKNEITLERDVVMSSKNSKVTSDNAKYQIVKEVLTNWGSVKSVVTNEKNGDKITIFSNEVESKPYKKRSKFRGNVHGHIKRKKIYEDSVNFRAKTLNLDLNKHLAELSDSVYLKKRGYEVRADRGEIYLDNYNKNLKYYVLYDDVKILEKIKLKNGNSLLRTGYAEKIEGIISEDKVILSGNPKVFQAGDVIKGNRITLRENSEVIEIDDAITNFILK